MARQQSNSSTTIVVIAALVLGGLGIYLNLSRGTEDSGKGGAAGGRGDEGIKLPE